MSTKARKACFGKLGSLFQGECQYEKDLLPHLHDEDNVPKNRQKSTKGLKTRPKSSSSRPRPPRSMTVDLEDIEEDATKKKPSSPHNTEVALVSHNVAPPAELEPLFDCITNDLDVVVENDLIESERTAAGPVDLDERDEDFELRAMFYLPKWSPVFPPSTVKLLPGGEEGLKVLLGDVAELLSRSPPPLNLDLDLETVVAASPPPAHWRPPQPFRVSFTLDVDDEDEDLLMMMSDNNSPKADEKTGGDQQPIARPHLGEQQQDISRMAADSPTWDEVFDKDDKDDDYATRENGKEPNIQEGEIQTEDLEEDVGCWDVIRKEEVLNLTDGKSVQPLMDNSMDLFEDDEAFLQMTIPDIPTPAVTPRTSPEAEGKATVTKRTSTVSSERFLLLTSPTCGPPRFRLNPQGHHSPTSTDTPCKEHAAAAEEPADSATQHKSFLEERSCQPIDGSHDFFSVNFDLGYSLEDSEEEQDDIVAPSRACEKTPVVGSSTPLSSFLTFKKLQEPCEGRLSTPQAQVQSRGENSSPIPSHLTSPVCLPGARRVVATPTLPSGFKRRRLEAQRALLEFERSACGSVGSNPHPGWVFFNRRKTQAGDLKLQNV